MPIYEYHCNVCNHELEVIQKMSEPPLQTCPHCGNLALQKRISAAGFRLKGGGWYETDFKNKNKKNIYGDRQEAAQKTADSATSSPSKKSKNS